MKHYLSLLMICLLGLTACDKGDPAPVEGVIRIADFQSKFVNTRHIDVWLPPAYHEDTSRRFPVIYMHDGQNLFDSKSTWNGEAWEVDSVLTKLSDEVKIDPHIVVGAWNTKDRFLEYAPQKPFEQMSEAEQKIYFDKWGEDQIPFAADQYLRFLVEELKPLIDGRFRTLPETEHTTVMGSSMGGLISAYAISTHPEVFGKAGCFSTHWPLDNLPDEFAYTYSMGRYLTRNLPDSNGVRIYFDYGDQGLDAMYEPHQQLIDSFMHAHGYTDSHWQTRGFPGHAHSEVAWRERFAIPAVFLLAE